MKFLRNISENGRAYWQLNGHFPLRGCMSPLRSTSLHQTSLHHAYYCLPNKRPLVATGFFHDLTNWSQLLGCGRLFFFPLWENLVVY